MKISRSVDFIVWKYLIPEFNHEVFKSKFVSFVAVLYIAFYSWPRKFIWHYFTGKGAELAIETKSVITENPAVHEFLISEIVKLKNENKQCGEFYVGQIHVIIQIINTQLGHFMYHVS